jgi:hypothetical protein
VTLRRKKPLKQGKPLARGGALKTNKPLRAKVPTPEEQKAKQKRQRKRQRELRERDFGPHADFVRSHPCIVCKRTVGVQSHHEPPRGKGGRRDAVKDQTPLCPEHHQDGPNARHKIGEAQFEALYGVDLCAVAADLWARSPYNPENGR